jgi:hypothetical protein
MIKWLNNGDQYTRQLLKPMLIAIILDVENDEAALKLWTIVIVIGIWLGKVPGPGF